MMMAELIINDGLHPLVLFISSCVTCVIILMSYKYVMFNKKNSGKQQNKHMSSPKSNSPKSNLVTKIGQLIGFYKCKKSDKFQWLSDLILSSPSSTLVLHRLFGQRVVFTADPATVQHILKTHFPIYIKGSLFKSVFRDLFGDSMFAVDGDMWKFQRHIAGPEFSMQSLPKFVKNVVDFELSERLLPMLSEAADNNKVLDLQDILHRFAFDNICMVAFGYDAQYLLPSLPDAKVADAFEDAMNITGRRVGSPLSIIWKLKRFLNIGHEKRLTEAVCEIRKFATLVIREKKTSFLSADGENILSRFLKCDNLEENLLVDIIIATILGGRDTSSAALTWFFWLIHNNKRVEQEIIREIIENDNKYKKSSRPPSILEELKDMVYTHAALCESMRLYPPAPLVTKQAGSDDILPDGTKVSKGMLVSYVTYTMGRSERIWGSDWAEFRPERWLEVEESEETNEKKLRFVPRDPYSYPVFQAGPRICLGKDMAILQMKRVVAAVLRNFRVVPAMEGFEPIYVATMTAKMKGGFPVKFERSAVKVI